MPVSAALLPILTSAGIALAVSFALSLILVLTRRWHLRFTGDSQLNLPQKIHREDIPRIGGLAIVGGFVISLVHLVWFGANPPAVSATTATLLLAGLAPIALAGFGEDITKRVGPQMRLGWMALSSLILLTSNHLWLDRIGVPFLDPLFSNWGIAIAFSVFACIGATNAYNLIDGLNGLLAGVSLITLAAIAWVAATLGDQKIFALAVLLGVAMIGWLPFNWPKARLFAGDGGAYSIGFLTAALLLLLIQRNPQVSPWFGLTAAALPIWETLYSIWRRSRSGLKTMEPDQSHLHQLVRTRLHWSIKFRALRQAGAVGADWTPAVQPAKQVVVKAPNGLCSPLLWGLHATAVVAGVATFDSTGAQAAVMGLFAVAYIVLHTRLLRSRARYRSVLAA
ncbi:MAG: MraY family glycosyltransferase [Burkholderiales bacterium]|nr:MraY family glycosyltransferase [Burkholderiales bacterium]